MCVSVADNAQPHEWDGHAERRAFLADLAERVRALQARRRPVHGVCPTGLTLLDAALGGGFALGSVHELLARSEGTAARSLALWSAARVWGGPGLTWKPRSHVGPAPPFPVSGLASFPAAGAEARPTGIESHSRGDAAGSQGNRWLLYVDTAGDLYPPGVAQLGVPLERLLIVRPRRDVDALWVCEQALACRAVAAIVLPVRALDATVSRRLQLAAEASGGVVFLLRPETRGRASFAATRLRIEPAPVASDDSGTMANVRRMRVTVLKVRAGQPSGPMDVELAEDGGARVRARVAV